MNGLGVLIFFRYLLLLGIGRTPYKAMFGTDPKVGLSITVLSAAAMEEVNTEEQLQQALAEIQPPSG